MSDWANHFSTIFPEVRVKRYMEMRGADVGPKSHILALTAFCAGLFYDTQASAAAWDSVKHWTDEDRQTLRNKVPREGLYAEVAGKNLLDLARKILPLVREGLERRNRADAAGRTEFCLPRAAGRDRRHRRKPRQPQARAVPQGRVRGRLGGNIKRAFDDCVY